MMQVLSSNMGKIKLDDIHAIVNLHMCMQESFRFSNEAAN